MDSEKQTIELQLRCVSRCGLNGYRIRRCLSVVQIQDLVRDPDPLGKRAISKLVVRELGSGGGGGFSLSMPLDDLTLAERELLLWFSTSGHVSELDLFALCLSRVFGKNYAIL